MRIGIACTLKPTGPLPAGAPDDLYEEFDSPATVQAIADVFRSLGHQVVELGDGRDFLQAVLHDPPDLVFNFAEGTGVSRSREARVPAVCEMLGIPYSGSDPLALAVALDKDMTRRVVESHGLTVPRGVTLTPPSERYDGDFAEFPPILDEAGLSLPVLAKPTCEGSSRGIRNRCLIKTAEDLGPTIVELWNNYHQPVLVEEYIAGDEVTIGLVGNDPPQPIGIMQLIPKQSPGDFVYSLEVKRHWHDVVDYVAPAPLPPEVSRAVEADAMTAFMGLGCRDLARVDFRIRDGIPYFLEINPLPGLNPESSDLLYLAYRMGFTYHQLLSMILDATLSRYGMK
ncbi:MAG: D-alanine--D-alanine ligase [Gemmataceae bacterium]|nr:D-alanine--D-alanine ligase [Gemmata sp.]MDW8196435.1 D-alanine--D-alanine ligase [Gemmataceae bacterium]